MLGFEEVESDMDPEEEFEPELILKQRVKQRKEQYFVKWLGYSVEESTWEKPENIASHPGVLRAWKAILNQKEKQKRQTQKPADIQKKKLKKQTQKPADNNKRSRDNSNYSRTRACVSKYKS